MYDIDVNKMEKDILKKTRCYNYFPKKECKFILLDFKKVLKKRKFKDTEYIFYNCIMDECDGEIINYGKHSIQISSKVAWIQLLHYLRTINKVNEKNIKIHMIKKNNYNYIFNHY